MARVLLTGMSGAGKTTLLAGLARRGVPTVDTDVGGWVTADGRWDEPRIDRLLSRSPAIVVAGTVENQGRFYDRFEHVVLLSAPLEVLLDRVTTRAFNPYGRSVAQREEITGYVETVEPLLRAGATLELDGRLPVPALVSAVSGLVGLPPPSDDVADDGLARLLSTAGGGPVDIAAIRARPVTRRSGPPMETADRTILGVPVRVYQPDASRTIVYLHGGGFVLGSLETHDAVVRRLASTAGARVVAVGYRLAPEHPFPAAVDDAVAVVRSLGADGPVALAGDSAGGFLAILTALRVRGEVPLSAQFLSSPNADLDLGMPSVLAKGKGWLLDVDDLRGWIRSWLPDPSALCSPLAADLSGMPPAVIVTAEHDPLRDEGNAYAARLIESGIPVTHRCEPGLLHNFPTLRDLSPASAAAEDRYLADIAEVMRRL